MQNLPIINCIRTMEEIKAFQKRLKELRETQGFTQAAFARELDISRRMMCYYEKESATLPTTQMLVKMANALDCPIDVLLGNKEQVDGRTAEAKIMKTLKKVIKLPKDDRDILLQMADALLTKNKIKH